MRKIFWGWFASLFIGGCNLGSVTEDNYFQSYAQSQCVVYKRCYRARFDGEYNGMTRCVDEVSEDLADEKQTLFPDCTFDEEQAQICLNLLNSSTCEEHWDDQNEIYSSCHEDIWDCPQVN